jgi:hypothetical protein
MRRGLRLAGLPDVLLADSQRAARFTRAAPVLAPYVDNANITARDRQSGDRVFGCMVQALLDKGFVLRDRKEGETTFEFLGFVLDGERGVLRHTAKRCWRLWFAIGRLLHSNRSSGQAMCVIAGPLCHHFGLRCGALSILQEVFSLARLNLSQVVPWPVAL